MHHRVIDAQEDKLLDRAAEPEEGHGEEEKISESSIEQCIRKNETGCSNEEKKIDQAYVGDLHDRFVVRL